MHSLRHPQLQRRQLLSALTSTACLLALGGCATEARAHRGLATLEVVDRDSGQVAPLYVKNGRSHVPGRPGARYALRLRNLSARRVLVVLSVDGVNVVSGQTADWAQTGYVLDAGRSYDINGWRKSESEVAVFEFAALEHSYAARTGRPDHVGVIGMAVFRERPPPAVETAPPVAAGPAPAARSSNGVAAAAGAAREKSSAEDSVGSRLGTGHGQHEWSVSRRTAFERASSTPEQLTELTYDSVERLVAAGIMPSPRWAGRPSPFPANPVGFVPDPPRW